MLYFLFLLSLSLFNVKSNERLDIVSTKLMVPKLPVVLMHGLLSNKNNMNELKLYLETEFNLNVIVPEIGNGILDSINLPLDQQGNLLCNELNSINVLESSFNFIGISQGGILARYYIEICGEYKVNNLITLVTPHGGVYNSIIGYIFNIDSYSFGSYWRDPFNLDEYKDTVLLAKLNNEKKTSNSKKYKNKIIDLSNFIMVYSPNDEVLYPPESGKFSTYMNDSYKVIPLNETMMYNTLGLKEMDMKNKIHIYQTNCSHAQHKDYSCFKQLYNMFAKYC